MPDYEAIAYEETDGVAWVTLNRPEVHNAFNLQMQRELKDVWRSLRSNDDVRCVVLTGAGTRAFCVGIDRNETMGGWESEDDVRAASATGVGHASSSPWHFDDPGDNVGPKTNDLWKPVIAAVNGMACGGAFYMLGEVEFIIAAEHATFFDPHVSYGMTACFESMHMLQKMPFGEIMRLALLGASERMTAQRARIRSASCQRSFLWRDSAKPRRGRPRRSPSRLRSPFREPSGPSGWLRSSRGARLSTPGGCSSGSAATRNHCTKDSSLSPQAGGSSRAHADCVGARTDQAVVLLACTTR